MPKPVFLVLGAGRKQSPDLYTLRSSDGTKMSARECEFLTLDMNPHVGPSLVCTLGLDRIPLDDDTVDAVVAMHVLEHIGQQGRLDEWIYFWEELYRVMKGGATLQFECPHSSSVWAWADPTHTRAINQYTFLYLNQHSYTKEGSAIPAYRFKADFAFGGLANGKPAIELVPDHTNPEVAELEPISFIRGILVARKPFKGWWEK